jgi:hypothetical protein
LQFQHRNPAAPFSTGGRFAGVPLKDLRELHKHSAENSVVCGADVLYCAKLSIR